MTSGENVRDAILRCLAPGLERVRPGVTADVREAAERLLSAWPDGTPPYVRAFADEETRRLIACSFRPRKRVQTLRQDLPSTSRTAVPAMVTALTRISAAIAASKGP